MSELVWGKKIMPLGNIVQESHKMQMVPLNRTYIDLFSFWEEEKDPPLSVAEMCQLELNPQLWMPLKFGSWSRPWIASLSFIEQINSAELPSPFRLQQCSDLFLCLLHLLPSFSLYWGCVRLQPWLSRACSFLFTSAISLFYDFSKMKDEILMLEPVHEDLPRHWHKLLAGRVYLSNKSWLLGKCLQPTLFSMQFPFQWTKLDLMCHSFTVLFTDS